jgi:hypothetical protein
MSYYELIIYLFLFHEENMDSHHDVNKPNISGGDICLLDSATTHTILKHKQYFSNMRMMKVKVNTILGSTDMIEGSRRANIMLPNGIKFIIDNALFYTKSRRNIFTSYQISLLIVYAWGHVVLHATTLIRIRPTTYHKFFPLQLVFGHEPNISNLRIFGCVVYIPIYSP